MRNEKGDHPIGFCKKKKVFPGGEKTYSIRLKACEEITKESHAHCPKKRGGGNASKGGPPDAQGRNNKTGRGKEAINYKELGALHSPPSIVEGQNSAGDSGGGEKGDGF